METLIQKVRTEAFSMSYFRFGHGEKPLVILPGLSVQSVMRSADAVASAYAALTADFTIYVFDRRENLPPVYTVSDMARDTAAAFEALGLRDVYLFGASQGGMIAMTIALEHPSLVKKMVLGSTTAVLTPEQWTGLEEWIRLAKEKDGVALYLSFGKNLYPPSLFGLMRAMLADAGKTVSEEDFARFVVLAEGMRGFDVSRRLPAISCPVLVLGAENDALLGGAASTAIAEKIPGARLHLYKDRGHAAYDTAPDYKDRLHAFFTE